MTPRHPISSCISLSILNSMTLTPRQSLSRSIYVVDFVTVSVSVSVSVSTPPFCCIFLCHVCMCLCLFVFVCVSRSKLSLFQCLYRDSHFALSLFLSVSISILFSTFSFAPFALPISSCARTNNADISMGLQPKVSLSFCLAPLRHGFLCSLRLLFVFFPHQQRFSYCGPIARGTIHEGVPALCEKTAWR